MQENEKKQENNHTKKQISKSKGQTHEQMNRAWGWIITKSSGILSGLNRARDMFFCAQYGDFARFQNRFQKRFQNLYPGVLKTNSKFWLAFSENANFQAFYVKATQNSTEFRSVFSTRGQKRFETAVEKRLSIFAKSPYYSQFRYI